MISVPIAVHNSLFKWQLDLFWFNHKIVYAKDAPAKAKGVIIKRNSLSETKTELMEWPLDIPHQMCESVFDYMPKHFPQGSSLVAVPLNIQSGLEQILSSFNDDDVIELLDCDMFHLKKHPPVFVENDELVVSDVYEQWHLRSTTEHKKVIERYFENNGRYYNGGFVPIIGKVSTFRKILPEWIAIHIDILKCDWPEETIKWWAGMYALQAACEKNKVNMIARDYCYIPGFNNLSENHYICHYSVDKLFNKKAFPHIKAETFENNIFYDRIKSWLATYAF